MDDRRYTRRNWIKTATAGVAGATIAGTAVTLQSCAPKSEETNDVSGGSEEKKPYFTRNKGIPCIYCSYCMPCKFGLDIPGIFRFVNEHMIVDEKAGETMAPYSTEERDDGDEMDDIARRRAFRAVYSSAIEELRQADKCTECKTCVPKCPEMIAIPNEMLEIARVTYRFY